MKTIRKWLEDEKAVLEERAKRDGSLTAFDRGYLRAMQEGLKAIGTSNPESRVRELEVEVSELKEWFREAREERYVVEVARDAECARADNAAKEIERLKRDRHRWKTYWKACQKAQQYHYARADEAVAKLAAVREVIDDRVREHHGFDDKCDPDVQEEHDNEGYLLDDLQRDVHDALDTDVEATRVTVVACARGGIALLGPDGEPMQLPAEKYLIMPLEVE